MSRPAAIFLDRDGVLNRAVVRDGKPYPPPSAAALEILPEAPDCLAALKRRGWTLIVVTNQPDVARGTQTVGEVFRMHAKLQAALPLDDILTCFHDDRSGCDCRKPRPGLLTRAALSRNMQLPDCCLIGDRWRDIDAGRAAGCKTVFIDYRYNERRPSSEPDRTVTSLDQAVQWILADFHADRYRLSLRAPLFR